MYSNLPKKMDLVRLIPQFSWDVTLGGRNEAAYLFA